jgi:GTP-binding protein
MTAVVAIVGRPNVGKSTLFNRLAGRRIALVHDAPGVTRDRREAEGRLSDLNFRLVDTAGLEDASAGTLSQRMSEQTLRAVADADITLLLIDARAGVTPDDRFFADRLRRTARHVVLVANKCEGGAGEAGRLDAFSLGFGEPVAVSAEHGEGLVDLFEALAPLIAAIEAEQARAELAATAPDGADAETADADADDAEANEADTETASKAIIQTRLAIVGQPNVGKSTLLNRLVNAERVLTGPEAGITRDSVVVEWTWQGRTIQLIDTAGLRRRAKVTAALEELATGDTIRSIRFAHVVVLVIDGTLGLAKQDFIIGKLAADEGRALVIVANMWDRVENRTERLAEINGRLADSLPQVKGVPVIGLSALNGQGVSRLMPTVIKAQERWDAKLKTGPLNRWLNAATQRHAPPRADGGGAVRIRYITQTASRPPTFALFANRANVADAYLRFLSNDLRDTFDLPGTPIRMRVRVGKNPYAPGR